MSFKWHEIRDHLMKSSTTLRFQNSFDEIGRSDRALADFTDPAALLDTLHGPSGCADRKNQVLKTLVGVAQTDGDVADSALTLLLLSLWPGLDAARRRLLWRGTGSPDDVSAEILARATETIRGLDLQRVNRIAATVLRNIERDTVRAHRREADRQQSISSIDPDEVCDFPAIQGAAADGILLHRDIDRLVGRDAELVVRVAVGGFSQREIAAELGLSEAAARKRYQRATRRLREAFHEFV